MRSAIARAVAIGTVVVAALCAVPTVPAGAQEKVWKHGLINAKADAGILLMVSRHDFAKNQGLKIEISQFKDDQLALKSLIAGELDSFEGGPQGVFAANAKGGDVKLLGCHWIVVPHGIYANEKIAKVQDLKGKQIAVSAPNSMPDMLARSALAKFGIADTEVKLAAVGGDNERYQALIGGVVDAAVISNEYQPVAPKNIHLLVAGREAALHRIGVTVERTPLAVLAAQDGRSPQRVALVRGAPNRPGSVLNRHDVGEITAHVGREDFPLGRLEAGEAGGQPVKGCLCLSWSGRRHRRAEHAHGLLG